LQTVAVVGKSTGRRSRGNRRNPLPPGATGCVRRSMVRRGSTVQVRQRAFSENPAQMKVFMAQAPCLPIVSELLGQLLGNFDLRLKLPRARVTRATTNSRPGSRATVRDRMLTAASPNQTTEDGAFVEPRGFNGWQTVANPLAAQTANHAKTVATDCDRSPIEAHGKQGVCRGLPPVAGRPLPEREEVDLLKRPSPANPKAHRT
jgi:hypothetical protein